MQAPNQRTTKTIAVAGATGRVGRHVVDVLRARGHEVVPMARSCGVDVITGDGLDAAVANASVIVDAATGPSPAQDDATAFFTTAARNLHAAGQRVGVERIVVVSIIGTDRFTFGYGAAKIAHEKAHEDGPIPAVIVRAAQFHEFVPQLLAWATQGDVAYVPKMRTQLVAARTVAEVVADVATGALTANGPFVEVAGPREERFVDAATLAAARLGRPLKVEEVSDPNDREHQLYASDALLPGPGAILGGPTFEEWLEAEAAPV